MASSSSAPYTPPNHRPPASITELAERAKASVWDPDKPLKHWLRTAEGARAAGKTYTERGDLENAFLELAKAATIVLEKMPTYKDYKVLLSSTQRHNMGQVSVRYVFLWISCVFRVRVSSSGEHLWRFRDRYLWQWRPQMFDIHHRDL